MSTIADLVIRLSANTDAAERGLNSFSGKVGKTFGKALLPAVGVLTGLGIAAKKTTDAASDLVESQNAVQVVFGKSSKKIAAFARVADKKAGLSMRQLNELVTPLGAGMRNYGDSADVAATKSLKLAQRAADMASVFNTSVPEALQAIQAALRGEADPIERFGVSMQETAVNAKAMQMGLAKTSAQVTASDKAQARYALILEQTNRLQGDFARTSGGAANSARINAAAQENLQAKLGTGLLPVVLAVNKAIAFMLGIMAAHPGTVMVLAAALGVLAVAIIAVNVAMFLLASPIYLVIIALVALGAGLVLAWQRSETFRQIVMAAFEAIRGVAIPVINWLRANIPAAWSAIQAATQAIWGAIVAYYTAIWARIRGTVMAAMAAVKGIIQADLGIIKAVVQTVMALIHGDWSAAWNGIKAITTAVLNGIVATLRGLLGVAAAAAKALGKAILDGIVNGVKALNARLQQAVHAGLMALVGLAGEAFRLAVSIGRAIVDGAMSGVSGLAGRIKGAVEGALQSALGHLNPFSPVEHGGWKYIGEPLARGAIDGWVRVSDPLPDLIERTVEQAAAAGERAATQTAKGIGVKFGESMEKGLLSRPNSLLHPFQAAKYAVDDWAGSEGVDNMTGVGVALATAVRAGFAGDHLLSGTLQGLAGKAALGQMTAGGIGFTGADAGGDTGNDSGDVYLDGAKVGRVIRGSLYRTKRQTGGLKFEAQAS